MDKQTVTKNQTSYLFSKEVILKGLLESGVITDVDFQRYDLLLYDRYHIDGSLRIPRPIIQNPSTAPEIEIPGGRETYISLTLIAKEKDEKAHSYLIQSWLRDSNVVDFLRMWERRNNPEFDDAQCEALCTAAKTPATTLTVKKWIEKTGAVGLVSKQGANGGTFAHPEIANAFRAWLFPEFLLELLQTYMRPVSDEEREEV